LFQLNDSINVRISGDPDTSDMPGNAYHSSPCVIAAVGRLDSTAQPFPCSARRRHCPVHRLGDLFASALLIGQRASRVVGRFAGSCVCRNRLPDECVIRSVTAVKKSGCCIVSSADSSSDFYSMPNKPINLPDVEPSDSDSSSTEWEHGVLPDIISRPSVRMMRAMASQSRNMAAGGRPNANRGQGMRSLPPIGRGSEMAVA